MTAEASRAPGYERALSRIALVCSCALITAVLAFAPGAGAASTGPIAFVSDRDGDPEIYKMAPDGTNVVQLTSNPAWDTDPSWSPGATRLAFSSNRDGDEDIYVMGADGSGVTNITDGGTGADRRPDWSPNGNKLVFTRANDIYTVGVAAGALTKLVAGRSPSWSPDGTKIAFSRSTRAGGDIFVMASDGSNVRALTDGLDADSPDWSPDGTRIAFESTATSGDGSRIHTMAANGTGVIQLAGTGDDYSPSWSGDGSSLTFTNLTLDAEVFAANADGTARRKLTTDPAYDFLPSWGPCAGVGCSDPDPTATTTGPGSSPTGSPTTPGASPTGTTSPTATPTGPGDRTATTTTLQFVTTRRAIKAAGTVRPVHPGLSLRVILAKRKGGRWVRVALRLPMMNSEGNFVTRFKSPTRTRRCRLAARFDGDSDHLGSSRTKTFRC